ncbi:lysoplasmalogenase family protein [Croceicoccus bisphenolivorans]|uniref:lysoplasmalogenase family protein n=1 Tax=Croceicoccus bisphenolivorans TaxID=1783232 RepID=UPI00082E83B4|nr:lysoplasmalogenase family protein [Croceicoccus bisphenolivorans]
MVKRALVERRPWLFASLIAALAWWAFGDSDVVPGLFKIAWKAIPLALLAVYAYQRHLGPDGTILSGVMAIAAMADAMSELRYAAAGTLMAFSLLLAIWLYSRNRRETTSISQKLLAAALVVILPLLAWILLAGEDGRLLVTGFSLMLGIMAAMAWTSRFSRYRVGAGAILFVLSELVLFAISGPVLRDSPLGELLVWPLYYSGQLMIATGVVSRLRRDAAA